MTRDEHIDALKHMLLTADRQMELPLAIYPDRVMIRSIGEFEDVQELVQEMREDMEGLTQYERIETLGGVSEHLFAKRNGELKWGRVTRDEDRLILEGWWERPRHEAPFDPERGER